MQAGDKYLPPCEFDLDDLSHTYEEEIEEYKNLRLPRPKRRKRRKRKPRPPCKRINTQFRDPGCPLTRRQLQVANALLEGMSVVEIATALELHSSTVRGHLHTMFGVLGVHNQTQFIIAALRKGILQL